MEDYYNIFKYPICKNDYISVNNLKLKYPKLNIRDFKLFNSGRNIDIAKIVYRGDIIIIKLNDVSVILSKNESLLFSSYKNKNDNFINYFRSIKYDKNYFPLFIFENILIYLSEYIDNFLKNYRDKFSQYSIDKFKGSKYNQILKLQHCLLLTVNNYKEIFESLIEIKQEDYKYILFNQSQYNDELNKILDIYKNQIKEDIKNLERFIKEVDLFVKLVSLQLSNSRNKIATKSMFLTLISLVFTIGTFSNSLLGTNLNSGLENLNYAVWVLMVIDFIFISSCYFILCKLYKLPFCFTYK